MMETVEDASLQERYLFSEVFGSDSTKPSDESASESRQPAHDSNKLCLGKSPREVFFFKLLYSEYKKVSEFFDQTLNELSFREGRIREDLAVTSAHAPASEAWATLAKSIYNLYKDLLLLETYAIMSYCGFSKILKKKDKCTGLPTRTAFMMHFVAKSNFATYPRLLDMIQRCQFEYDEVSRQLATGSPLLEDQRLFIDMILKMNVDASGVAAQEGGRHALPLADMPKYGNTATNVDHTIEDEDDDDDDEEEDDDDDLSTGSSQLHPHMRPLKRMKL